MLHDDVKPQESEAYVPYIFEESLNCAFIFKDKF